MLKAIIAVFALSLMQLSCSGSSPPNNGTIWTISGNGITMKASQRFGAAIYSLQWNGLEFINSDDVGRALQTAYWLDKVGTNDGGNNNPNEAGGSSANKTPTQILSADIPAPNVLDTQVHPALWFPYNGQSVTADVLHKRVTIGAKGLPNVIQHDVTVVAAAPHSFNSVLGLVGYLTKTFTKLYTFDPQTRQVTEVAYTPTLNNVYLGVTGEKLPLIMASPDGKYAIGIYSPIGTYAYYMQLTGNVVPASGMINIWEAAMQTFEPWPAGSYSWTVFYAVGTLADVQNAMVKIVHG